jgi:transcriptional regulator GlxA family with amidase domain
MVSAVVVTTSVKNKKQVPVSALLLRMSNTIIPYGWKTGVLAFFVILVILLIRRIKKASSSPRFLTTTRLSIMDKEVQRACRFMEKNYADPSLNTAVVCKNIVTGEAFLEAIMNKELGISVHDFIEHVRINKAKILLQKDMKLSVAIIAPTIGFTSHDTFLATFKKITGISFEEYTDPGLPKK